MVTSVKKEYAASKIAITYAMGNSETAEWNLSSIMKGDIRMFDEIIKILDRWNKEYFNVNVEEMVEEPTAEDLVRMQTLFPILTQQDIKAWEKY